MHHEPQSQIIGSLPAYHRALDEQSALELDEQLSMYPASKILCYFQSRIRCHWHFSADARSVLRVGSRANRVCVPAALSDFNHG